jgi:hypothetical protein
MSKATRIKLTDAFVEALQLAWTQHGDSVLAELRIQDPKAFAKLVSELTPRQSEIAVNNSDKYSHMSVDELRGFLIGIEPTEGEGTNVYLEAYLESHLLECERILRNLKKQIKRGERPPPEYHSMSPADQWRVRQGRPILKVVGDKD